MGMFKWNPDYDSAGDAYSRAATAYKVGGNKEKAIDCFDKACNCYKQMRTLFQAARMLDQAVLLSRDLNRMDDVVQYAETVGLEDEPRKAMDHMARAARLQVRCKKYDESV